MISTRLHTGEQVTASKQTGHRPLVLVYGSFQPGDVPCGITSVMRSFVDSCIRDTYDIEVVSTFREADADRGIWERLRFGSGILVKTIGKILRVRPALIDVHAVAGRELFKQSAVLIAARLTRCPSVLRIHGGDFDRVYARASRSGKWLTRFILRLPSRVVLLSEGWAEIMRGIEPRMKSAVIHNLVSCDEFESLGRNRPDTQDVLFLANLCERKGHFDALDAAVLVRESFPEVRFRLAGVERDPGALAELQAYAKRRGLEDTACFLGAVSGEAKAREITHASILILPSHTEAMPISIMEGMAAALPVVATRVGAIPEMIQDEQTGFLIDPRDPESLAKRIVQLLGDRRLREELGERARAFARSHWDKDVVAHLSASLFAEISRGGR
jgi:glycosyltransferase involved in cell wall biosynthesis